MARFSAPRRAWLLMLLALVLIAFAGHLVGEAAQLASSDHARLELSTGYLHTGLVLPVVAALVAGLVPLLIWFVAPPTRHAYRAPAWLHPPTYLLAH